MFVCIQDVLRNELGEEVEQSLSDVLAPGESTIETEDLAEEIDSLFESTEERLEAAARDWTQGHKDGVLDEALPLLDGSEEEWLKEYVASTLTQNSVA